MFQKISNVLSVFFCIKSGVFGLKWFKNTTESEEERVTNATTTFSNQDVLALSEGHPFPLAFLLVVLVVFCTAFVIVCIISTVNKRNKLPKNAIDPELLKPINPTKSLIEDLPSSEVQTITLPTKELKPVDNKVFKWKEKTDKSDDKKSKIVKTKDNTSVEKNKEAETPKTGDDKHPTAESTKPPKSDSVSKDSTKTETKTDGTPKDGQNPTQNINPSKKSQTKTQTTDNTNESNKPKK